MDKEIKRYNAAQAKEDKKICNLLSETIDTNLPGAESKIWHRHPVWFLDGNPIVGYSKLKDSVRLMFWSGRDFDDNKLVPGSGKFKDASLSYTEVEQINSAQLKRLLKQAKNIQWDYKNIYKRKGKLVRLK